MRLSQITVCRSPGSAIASAHLPPDGQDDGAGTGARSTSASLPQRRQQRREVKELVAGLEKARRDSQRAASESSAQFAYPGDATVSEMRHGQARLH